MNDGERRRGRKKEKKGTAGESERERKSERPGDSGGEENGKRVTQTESGGPRGQFRETINSEPTRSDRKRKREWDAFLRVHCDMCFVYYRT